MVLVMLVTGGLGYLTIGAGLFILSVPALLFASAGEIWSVTSTIGAAVGVAVGAALTWDEW